MASTQKEKQRLEELMLQQATAARAGEAAAGRGRDGATPTTAPPDPDDLDFDAPPPAYGEHVGKVQQDRDGFGTKARVTDDGRVNITIDQRNRKLTNLLSQTVCQLCDLVGEEEAPPPPYIPPSLGGEEGVAPPPPMNVVIQIVGSRGDVQPFVALAKTLQNRYGHRVRLATHPNFKDFVRENGIEFFNIGGDPQGLMAFMVKNPGLMPGFDSLRAGDVGKRRKEIAEYLEGCWRSCFEAGDGFGDPVSDDTTNDSSSQLSASTDPSQRPFVADCIIANPPSFAHIHVAEKLGIPVHIYFTMPYSPTQAFPHPLANIQASNTDENLTNYMSYGLVEMLTWQGLGDVINRFRKRNLGLDEISLMRAPGILQRLKIPHTYAWSSALIPKPRDWGSSISIAGFFLLDLAKNYTPAPDLKAFLDAGPPPVYIGFGSIVLDDPNGMTKLIFDAIRRTGQRALVSKGWGGVGADELDKPDGVFMLGNVPHDWLFNHVSCVVHHGGAGTTSTGIIAGRPTLVVPFFGDQPFWGSMVARAGAGPTPIPNKVLTSDALAKGIMACLQPQMQQRAEEMARKMAKESGTEVGAQTFHQFLDVDDLRCEITPSRTAVWVHKGSQARLSAMAACTLAQEGLLDFHDLKLFRPREYDLDDGPWDPLSGGASALIGTFSSMVMGVADLPGEAAKLFKGRPARNNTTNTDNTDGKKAEDAASSSASWSSKTGSVASSTDTKFGEPSTAPLSRTSLSSAFQDLPLKPKAGDGAGDAQNVQLNQPESRSPSRQPSPTRDSHSSSAKMWKTAATTGKGMNRIVGASLKSPMEFSVNMAKGFHNAPKLYGDDTVRQPDKVSGWRSGLKVAGKEFGLGMYDGITGLVTQPMKGATEEGGLGFLKGFGKGVGGFFFKPGAALFAIPAYSMKGVYKEVAKLFGSSPQTYIIAARAAQGLEEYQVASAEEKQDVVMRWTGLQKASKRDSKKKALNQPFSSIPTRQAPKEPSVSQYKDDAVQEQSMPQVPEAALVRGPNNFQSQGRVPVPADSTPAPRNIVAMPSRKSVPQRSYGASVESPPATQVMRVDVDVKQRDETLLAEEVEDEQFRMALAESASDAKRFQNHRKTEDDELQRALTESLKTSKGQGNWQDDSGGFVPKGSSSKAAIPPIDPPPSYDYRHVEGTTRAEFDRQQAAGLSEKSQQEETEERMVLEYIKKRSLLEEEERRQFVASRSPMASMNDEDDEELQRALKLSMQENGSPRGSGVSSVDGQSS